MKNHSGKYNLFMVYILQMANFLFPLITYPYVTRTLGAESLGNVSFANSVANYFAAIATFGISSYAVRTCARVRNEKEKLGKTAGELLAANGVTTAAAFLMYLSVIFLVPAFRSQWGYMLLYGISFFTDFMGMSWLYTALEKYTFITVRTLLLKIISLALIFLLLHDERDGMAYAAIIMGSVVCTNIINYLYAQKMMHIPVSLKNGFSKHYHYTKWFFAQSVAITLFSNMDVTMMGFASTRTQIGNYEVALKIKVLLTTLVSSLGNLFLPRLSSYIKEKKMEAYWHTVYQSFRYNAFVSLPVIGFVILEADESIRIFCGAEYQYAGTILKVLVITVFLIGLSTITGSQILLSIEKEKSLFLSIVMGAGLNLGMNYLLIPIYHGAGAAASTVCAEFLVLAVQMVCLHNKKIRIPLWGLVRKPCTGALTATIVTAVWNQIVPLTGFLEVLAAGLLFGSIYGLMMWLLKDVIIREILTTIVDRNKDREHGEES